jgi:hypothetical protein
MAKLINITKIKDGKVSRHPMRAAKIFEHGGFHLAVHRPLTPAGKASTKGWIACELTTGQSIGGGGWVDTVEEAERLCRDRITNAEGFSPGQLARIVAQAVEKHGPANDPANLPTAKAPAASEYRAALARVLEILDSGDQITESHYGTEIAAWRSLVEG